MMEQNVKDVLETAATLENFVDSMEYYSITDKAVEYNNCGYSRTYTLPDWTVFLEEIKKSYTWIATMEDLKEAVTDALYNYLISSRG